MEWTSVLEAASAHGIRASMVDVLTVRLDATSQARFEALRQRHFPPERNLIPAHVTMFHALPQELWVREALLRATSDISVAPVTITGLRFLGKGVAYTLAAPAMLRLHAALAQEFAEVLPTQDRQRFQPHVVVQNKVAPEAARILLAQLQAGFAKWEARAEGLDLWHYLGGPWEHAETFLFRKETTA